MTVFLEFSVDDRPGAISPDDAGTIAALAGAAGLAGLRLTDPGVPHRGLDPSLVAAYLADRYPGLPIVFDAPTTGNAPYNLARRAASVDRASGGRTGLVLRAGGGDEVSAALTPDGPADPAERWSEYSRILRELWESFPASALIGDQDAGRVIDDAQLTPIDHEGDYYRVRGPLDGPASPQGRPVLLAADPHVLGYRRIADTADAVLLTADQLPAAIAEFAAARRRPALLLTAPADTGVPELRRLRGEYPLTGVVLSVTTPDEAVHAIRSVAPRLHTASPTTLQAVLSADPVPAGAGR
ncbi:LLM class flavin-dependent oxidoreductase [Gordonia sp. VNK21]|uniref:LLM class flavin-dependent oxidoreductase n=1 Tax=Gordonia sp. VNK21 TaxID=3382483 RepID=UPI0038D36F5B